MIPNHDPIVQGISRLNPGQGEGIGVAAGLVLFGELLPELLRTAAGQRLFLGDPAAEPLRLPGLSVPADSPPAPEDAEVRAHAQGPPAAALPTRHHPAAEALAAALTAGGVVGLIPGCPCPETVSSQVADESDRERKVVG